MAEKKKPPRGPQLELAGGHLAVAFVNTAAAAKGNRQMGLDGYEDLLTWGLRVGVLQAAGAERLRRRAAEHPEEAKKVYAWAIRLRITIARLFAAVAMQSELPAAELRAFNDALERALAPMRLVSGGEWLRWGWTGDEDALDRMLWPVLHAAAELLISVEGRPHIRQCARRGCLLYFIDRTPAGRRRWCEMKTCGNRAKAMRYYLRTGRKTRQDKMRRLGLWKQSKPRKKT